MDVSLRRVEAARRDDGVDLAFDRPNADLAGLRDLLGAVAGGEQVERALAKHSFRAPARACGRSRLGACGLGLWVFGHVGPYGIVIVRNNHDILLIYSKAKCFGNFLVELAVGPGSLALGSCVMAGLVPWMAASSAAMTHWGRTRLRPS